MPWVYDETNRWWCTEFGGLPASVTQMPEGWVAGFNGKPLTSLYKDNEAITDRFIFEDAEEGKRAVEHVAEQLGIEIPEQP